VVLRLGNALVGIEPVQIAKRIEAREKDHWPATLAAGPPRDTRGPAGTCASLGLLAVPPRPVRCSCWMVLWSPGARIELKTMQRVR